MPAASASTIVPAARVHGRVRRAWRQVDLAPLRAARRARRRHVAPRQLRARRRLPLDAGLPRRPWRRDPSGGGADRYPTGTRFRGLAFAAGPLDAGNSGTTMRLLAGILAGQPFSTDDGRRRVAVAPADAPGHRAARRGWAPASRPTDGHAAADDSRRATARHRLPARGAERPGQERGAPRRPARRGHDHGRPSRRRPAITPSGRCAAFGVARRASTG